jgi:hypothetical protein
MQPMPSSRVSQLSFGPRTAQQLMVIAKGSRINPNHGSGLPSSWRTLYAIARLPEDAYQVMLTEGSDGLPRDDEGDRGANVNLEEV